MKEIWKPLSYFPFSEAYEVSNMGRVRGLERIAHTGRLNGQRIPARVLNGCKTKFGYLQVKLRFNGMYWFPLVHKLVAIAFLPPKPSKKHEINHKDSNGLNNAVSNLEWVTKSENQQHILRNNRRPVGEKIWWTNLTDKDVLEIRRRYSKGKGPTVLGKEFGVPKERISAIVSGKTWKHLGGISPKHGPAIGKRGNRIVGVGSSLPYSRLNEDDVKEARNLYNNLDASFTEIAEVFGVSRETIRAAILRRTWKHVP
jgi:hypothetical protein